MSEIRGTKALELWCKRLVRDCPNVHIDNMTTSWRDGIAFCALVHHFRPDLIDMSKLKPEKVYENNQLAFSVAEKYLGIPALLDAEDMVENDVPDRLSILTYLSQFYQRLGHTVSSKVLEETQASLFPATSAQPMAPISFGKTGLDKCTACGLPVYLAQRLLVSHKLYHRRCFRCSKCSGHLNPKNYHIIEGSEFCCDSCKNEKTLSKFLNNNDHDQMGMLAFSDMRDTTLDMSCEEPDSQLQKPRPRSILERISMFEKNIEKDTSLGNQIMNLTIKDSVSIRDKEISSTSGMHIESDLNNVLKDDKSPTQPNNEVALIEDLPEKQYKSNIDKFNFLQTQLTGNDLEVSKDSVAEGEMKHNSDVCTNNGATDPVEKDVTDIDISGNVLKTESNVTDDSRLAKSNNKTTDNQPCPQEAPQTNDEGIKICVPPRRKKHALNSVKRTENISKPKKEYPDHLNPFSDDDEDEHEDKEAPKKLSTNPFGSSDEEDDEVPPIPTPSKLTSHETATPVKRLIAVNPFWSDGEEPSSDEETYNSGKMHKSPITTSTPNLPGGTPRRKKAKAPPPPVATLTASPRLPRLDPATSMDDVASISSLSSYNSTMHYDQKSIGRVTPQLKKRLAPTPDSESTVSGDGSLDKSVDTSPLTHNSLEGVNRRKGPAPGLPLPSRRLVRPALPPEQLQVQLDLLETQQLGLERQGVLIERIIRDKCEGDEANSVPQEEVEDLVIQLCELVNEKNDLFRKQTELMYIRRQQRLEQEQADIEHEIRIIQSRPTVNRIDADKAREEQLVARLVEIVRMRDELVQQLDSERRRERQEDLAIAASIATKRAQRNSESNSSSMKSVEATPKKNKVKDKVKKQLKKAKHTLIPKRKEDTADRKEDKSDKDKQSK